MAGVEQSISYGLKAIATVRPLTEEVGFEAQLAESTYSARLARAVETYAKGLLAKVGRPLTKHPNVIGAKEGANSSAVHVVSTKREQALWSES